MPGPRRRGEGARPVPARADRHADGGDLVFRLHDGVILLSRSIEAVARAQAFERLGDRRRGRDRIPGAHRRSAVDRAERRGVISLDENAVAGRLAAPDANAERAGEARHRFVMADPQRPMVGLDQLVLALEPFRRQRLHDGEVDIEERGERADIDDVAVELALSRLGIFRGADFGQRHPERDDVVATRQRRERAGRIVEEVAAGVERGHVLGEGLGVHRHQNVGAAARSEPSILAHPDLVPGRQALDVGGEDIARRDWHAHAQDRPREQEIGAGRARAVDVGEANDEIVDRLYWHACPA